MAELHVRVGAHVLAALDGLARSSGVPRDHLVERALAEYLGVEHHTLFQVSTAGALVEGVYQGAVSVGLVREHGDFGLGTFADLDGEMVVLDGHVHRVSSDGDVHEVPDEATTPFAVVTRFGAPDPVEVDVVDGLAALTAAIDGKRDSANVFFAVRVDGHFDAVHVRAACRTAPGVPLARATEHQAEFELTDVDGTMVGFWSPPYASGVEVAGYHLHFSPTTVAPAATCSTPAPSACRCGCRRRPTCTWRCPTPSRSDAPISPTTRPPTSTARSTER